MPYRNEYVENEIALTHNGVTVYNIYRNDEVDDGLRAYWYGLHPDASDQVSFPDMEGSFDIRDLPEWRGWGGDRDSNREPLHDKVLAAAIDNGTIAFGWMHPRTGVADVPPPEPPHEAEAAANSPAAVYRIRVEVEAIRFDDDGNETDTDETDAVAYLKDATGRAIHYHNFEQAEGMFRLLTELYKSQDQKESP